MLRLKPGPDPKIIIKIIILDLQHWFRKQRCPEVEFINDNFWKILRLLLNAIHKRVFPLDFTLAIDFSSPGSRPWISFVMESKITCFTPLVIGRELA
jgi:hypothetical protein